MNCSFCTFILAVITLVVMRTNGLGLLQSVVRPIRRPSFSSVSVGIFSNNRRSYFSMKDEDTAKNVLNKFSRTITEPPSQGASQAMLYATGLTPDNINAPQV